MADEISLKPLLSADPAVVPATPAQDKVADAVHTAAEFQPGPDLTTVLTPGMDPDKILDALLATPPERFNPFRAIKLPSLGLYYNWANGMVDVRPMDIVAEKILSTADLVRSGQALDYIYRACVRLPEGFDPLDLLVGDRVYLLYYLRGLTYGNMYEFMAACDNCGDSGTYAYDLVELYNTVVWADQRLGPEPFKVILPGLSASLGQEAWVGVRFLRGRDSQTIQSMVSNNKLMTGRAVRRSSNPFERRREANQVVQEKIDSAVTDNLENVIVSFMGVEDPIRVRQLASTRLSQSDRSVIRYWLRQNTPGPETMAEFTCQSCKKPFTIPLPITDSFFRAKVPATIG